MKSILVLGGGMVGQAIALDLSSNHLVTIADKDSEVLSSATGRNPALKTIILDVTQKTVLERTLQGYDIVVNAVPGFLGYDTLKSIIIAGKNVVDIAFFPENGLPLDDLAKSKGVTAIIDCGVAPGLDNFILGYYNERLALSDFECLVGGLPKIKKWPFYYKAPFSPSDVIEEYTRIARYKENGEIVEREPLTDCEYIEFDRVGTLEAFNSDGLRSILFTMPHIPNLKEKTLRYPGHVEYVKVLKKSGFFDMEPVLINGTPVSPLEFTSKVLFREWKLDSEEEEFTVMRVTLKGSDRSSEMEEIVYNLYDEYSMETNTSSMARTTGYTATAAVNMVLGGLFNKKGVFPPELIGGDEKCFNFILKYLEERGVRLIKESRRKN